MKKSPDSDTSDYPTPGSSDQESHSCSSALPVTVEIGVATHQGNVRPNNEDNYLVARADRSLQMLYTSLPPGEVPAWTAECSFGLVVADGMGGHAAGEVASRLALRSLIENVLATPDWIMRDPVAHARRIEQRMLDRFTRADEDVQEEARRNPQLAGMGTTMTVALSVGRHAVLGHVGDSRAYLFHEGLLHLLTRDHSYAQALVEEGYITPEQARTHHMRNVLLQSLGGGNVETDVRHLTLDTSDQLLLCTDGLTEMVPNDTIQEILRKASSPTAACDALVDAALAAGGRDNITVVLAKYSW